MRAVAVWLGLGILTAAEYQLLFVLDGEFDRRALGGLVRAIAERLVCGLAAGAPVIGAGLDLRHEVRHLAAALWEAPLYPPLGIGARHVENELHPAKEPLTVELDQICLIGGADPVGFGFVGVLVGNNVRRPQIPERLGGLAVCGDVDLRGDHVVEHPPNTRACDGLEECDQPVAPLVFAESLALPAAFLGEQWCDYLGVVSPIGATRVGDDHLLDFLEVFEARQVLPQVLEKFVDLS